MSVSKQEWSAGLSEFPIKTHIRAVFFFNPSLVNTKLVICQQRPSQTQIASKVRCARSISCYITLYTAQHLLHFLYHEPTPLANRVRFFTFIRTTQAKKTHARERGFFVQANPLSERGSSNSTREANRLPFWYRTPPVRALWVFALEKVYS